MCHQPPGTDVCNTFKSSLMRGRFRWYQSRRLVVGRGPRSETHFPSLFPLSPSLFNFTDRFYAKRIHLIFVFQMAEEGWTQGDCQAAPGFPSLLINALESLGVTERPRYYSREYEHHGTLRCRVILVIARSDRYPDIQPWCNTRFIKEHKPSNHIHARIKSHVYTTE